MTEDPDRYPLPRPGYQSTPWPNGQPQARAGHPPPPAAVGRYAAPPPGYGILPPFSVGEALDWAWKKFSRNVAPLLLAGAAIAVSLLISAIFVGNLNQMGGPGSNDFLLGSVCIVGAGIFFIAAIMLGSAYVGGLLDIANDVPVTIRTFFRPRRPKEFILLRVGVGMLSITGLLACFIGGVVVSIFTMFGTIALLDRQLSIADALKMSFRVVRSNFERVLLAWLTVTAIGIVGVMLVGVDVLVTLPLALLVEIYAFRKLTGAEVVPASGGLRPS